MHHMRSNFFLQELLYAAIRGDGGMCLCESFAWCQGQGIGCCRGWPRVREARAGFDDLQLLTRQHYPMLECERWVAGFNWHHLVNKHMDIDIYWHILTISILDIGWVAWVKYVCLPDGMWFIYFLVFFFFFLDVFFVSWTEGCWQLLTALRLCAQSITTGSPANAIAACSGMLYSSHDDNVIREWCIETGEELRTFEHPGDQFDATLELESYCLLISR